MQILLLLTSIQIQVQSNQDQNLPKKNYNILACRIKLPKPHRLLNRTVSSKNSITVLVSSVITYHGKIM